MSQHSTLEPAPPATYSAADLLWFGEQLERIRDVAHRKRQIGLADPALEAGCWLLERRLSDMRGEVAQ